MPSFLVRHRFTSDSPRRESHEKAVDRFVVLLLAVAIFALPTPAEQSLARFDGGIGATPLRAGGTANQVQGVNPGGVPWVITSLKANVQIDGRIRVDGRGCCSPAGTT